MSKDPVRPSPVPGAPANRPNLAAVFTGFASRRRESDRSVETRPTPPAAPQNNGAVGDSKKTERAQDPVPPTPADDAVPAGNPAPAAEVEAAASAAETAEEPVPPTKAEPAEKAEFTEKAVSTETASEKPGSPEKADVTAAAKDATVASPTEKSAPQNAAPQEVSPATPENAAPVSESAVQAPAVEAAQPHAEKTHNGNGASEAAESPADKENPQPAITADPAPQNVQAVATVAPVQPPAPVQPAPIPPAAVQPVQEQPAQPPVVQPAVAQPTPYPKSPAPEQQPEEIDDFGSVVRPYTWTGGRTRSSYDLRVETLVSTTKRGRDAAAQTSVEHRTIAELCQHARSVAEVAAHLSVPLGVVRVLLSDMAEAGLLIIHETEVGEDAAAQMLLMERVLSGLRRL